MLDKGAQAKIQKFTARHLALSVNCILLTRDYIMPHIKAHLIDHASNPNGFNIRTMIDKQLNELMNSLDFHIDAIMTTLSSLIVDSVPQVIETASKALKWDEHIEKSSTIQVNPYIDQMIAPLFSLAKVLFQVLCLTQEQIEK